MSEPIKEGAGRPLPLAAPKNPAAQPEQAAAAAPGAAAPTETGNKTPSKTPPEPAPAAHWLAAAVCSYPLAYLYVRLVLFCYWDGYYGLTDGWGVPLFAGLFLLGVELLARAERRAPACETPFWAVCWLAQSVAMPLWGWQGGGLGVWQFLLWHGFAVWYVLARTGMLAAGHTGSLFFLDGIAGAFTLPWSNFMRRIAVLVRGVAAVLARPRAGGAPRQRRLGVAAASAAAALLACLYAGAQLAAADPAFAAMAEWLGGWLRAPWKGLELVEFLMYLVLSLPVGAWLFGLVAGGLRRTEAPVTGQRFFAALRPWQRLPGLTAALVLGALCAMYGLFFALQAAAFAGAVGVGGLSGSQVSAFAVSGFWELCRVLMLNFALLACIRFFGPELERRRGIRVLRVVFAGFGVAFTLLAGCKLGFYIGRYGWTMRRAVSGWFLCVLAVWAVLALVWTVRWPAARFGPARAGIAVLAAGFTLLCCINVNGLVLRANLARNAGGVLVDVQTLRVCGVGSYQPHAEEYAALLAEYGWFVGRDTVEINELYAFDERQLDREGCGRVQVLPRGSESESLLMLEFEDQVCTRAFTAPRAAAGLETEEQAVVE